MYSFFYITNKIMKVIFNIYLRKINIGNDNDFCHKRLNQDVAFQV